jgi:hypothetical protein
VIPIDYNVVRRAHSDELRMLWIDDYYDGPLSGMLLFKGRLCRYECCDLADEHGNANVWRYVIRELSDDQIADEERWHALFVEHVGDHWTIHGDGHRGAVKPASEHAKFYDEYNKRGRVDYSTRPIVAWFEM